MKANGFLFSGFVEKFKDFLLSVLLVWCLFLAYGLYAEYNAMAFIKATFVFLLFFFFPLSYIFSYWYIAPVFLIFLLSLLIAFFCVNRGVRIVVFSSCILLWLFFGMFFTNAVTGGA